MDLAKKKLGMLLSTGLEHANLETAVGLARAALDRGAELYLYLIDDGVRALDDPRIRALPTAGRGSSCAPTAVRSGAFPSRIRIASPTAGSSC